jgi:hypothetical protein
LFTPSDPAERQAWLQQLGLEQGKFAVFMPGGRGEQRAAKVDPAALFVARGETVRRRIEFDRGGADRPRTNPPSPAIPACGYCPRAPGASAAPARRRRTRGQQRRQHTHTCARAPAGGGERAVGRRPGTPQSGEPRARACCCQQHWTRRKIAAAALSILRDPQVGQQLRQRIDALGLVNVVDEAVNALRKLARA